MSTPIVRRGTPLAPLASASLASKTGSTSKNDGSNSNAPSVSDADDPRRSSSTQSTPSANAQPQDSTSCLNQLEQFRKDRIRNVKDLQTYGSLPSALNPETIQQPSDIPKSETDTLNKTPDAAPPVMSSRSRRASLMAMKRTSLLSTQAPPAAAVAAVEAVEAASASTSTSTSAKEPESTNTTTSVTSSSLSLSTSSQPNTSMASPDASSTPVATPMPILDTPVPVEGDNQTEKAKVTPHPPQSPPPTRGSSLRARRASLMSQSIITTDATQGGSESGSYTSRTFSNRFRNSSSQNSESSANTKSMTELFASVEANANAPAPATPADTTTTTTTTTATVTNIPSNSTNETKNSKKSKKTLNNRVVTTDMTNSTSPDDSDSDSFASCHSNSSVDSVISIGSNASVNSVEINPSALEDVVLMTPDPSPNDEEYREIYKIPTENLSKHPSISFSNGLKVQEWSNIVMKPSPAPIFPVTCNYIPNPQRRPPPIPESSKPKVDVTGSENQSTSTIVNQGILNYLSTVFPLDLIECSLDRTVESILRFSEPRNCAAVEHSDSHNWSSLVSITSYPAPSYKYSSGSLAFALEPYTKGVFTCLDPLPAYENIDEENEIAGGGNSDLGSENDSGSSTNTSVRDTSKVVSKSTSKSANMFMRSFSPTKQPTLQLDPNKTYPMISVLFRLHEIIPTQYTISRPPGMPALSSWVLEACSISYSYSLPSPKSQWKVIEEAQYDHMPWSHLPGCMDEQNSTGTLEFEKSPTKKSIPGSPKSTKNREDSASFNGGAITNTLYATSPDLYRQIMGLPNHSQASYDLPPHCLACMPHLHSDVKICHNSWVTISEYKNYDWVVNTPAVDKIQKNDLRVFPITLKNEDAITPGTAFSLFRLRMTDVNHLETWEMGCSGFDIFGTVKPLTLPPPPQSQNIQKQKQKLKQKQKQKQKSGSSSTNNTLTSADFATEFSKRTIVPFVKVESKTPQIVLSEDTKILEQQISTMIQHSNQRQLKSVLSPMKSRSKNSNLMENNEITSSNNSNHHISFNPSVTVGSVYDNVPSHF